MSQNGESEEMLGKHPLSGLEGAGAMLFILRKQFHSLLQTTADIMPKVGSIHHTVHNVDIVRLHSAI